MEVSNSQCVTSRRPLRPARGNPHPSLLTSHPGQIYSRLFGYLIHRREVLFRCIHTKPCILLFILCLCFLFMFCYFLRLVCLFWLFPQFSLHPLSTATGIQICLLSDFAFKSAHRSRTWCLRGFIKLWLLNMATRNSWSFTTGYKHGHHRL